jgi:hypothetical protein
LGGLLSTKLVSQSDLPSPCAHFDTKGGSSAELDSAVGISGRNGRKREELDRSARHNSQHINLV